MILRNVSIFPAVEMNETIWIMFCQRKNFSYWRILDNIDADPDVEVK